MLGSRTFELLDVEADGGGGGGEHVETVGKWKEHCGWPTGRIDWVARGQSGRWRAGAVRAHWEQRPLAHEPAHGASVC